MKPELRSVGRILVVAKNVEDAMSLQDRLVQSGNQVLTAYSLKRALQLANGAALDDAVIDVWFEGAAEIVGALRSRQIRFIYNGGSVPSHVERLAIVPGRRPRPITAQYRERGVESPGLGSQA